MCRLMRSRCCAHQRHRRRQKGSKRLTVESGAELTTLEWNWNVPLICWRRNMPQVPLFVAFSPYRGMCTGGLSGRIGSGWLTLMNVSRLSKLNGKLTQLQQTGRRSGRWLGWSRSLTLLLTLTLCLSHSLTLPLSLSLSLSRSLYGNNIQNP